MRVRPMTIRQKEINLPDLFLKIFDFFVFDIQVYIPFTIRSPAFPSCARFPAPDTEREGVRLQALFQDILRHR